MPGLRLARRQASHVGAQRLKALPRLKAFGCVSLIWGSPKMASAFPLVPPEKILGHKTCAKMALPPENKMYSLGQPPPPTKKKTHTSGATKKDRPIWHPPRLAASYTPLG